MIHSIHWKKYQIYTIAFMYAFICFFTSISMCYAEVVLPENSRPNDKNVLVVNSYHRGYKWSDELFDSIVDFFDSNTLYKTELHAIYLDSKRVHDKNIWRKSISEHVEQFPANYFDVIVIFDDNAFTSMLDLYQKNTNYQNIPVVFCGVNYLPEETYKEIIGPDSYPLFTGILQDGDYWNTALLATMLNPTLETIYIIYDNSTTGQSIYADSMRDLVGFTKETGVSIQYLAGTEFTNDELLDEIEKISANSAVIYDTWQIDVNGEYVNKEQFVDAVFARVKQPWYSVIEQSIYPKVVGGSVISAHHHGQDAASLVHEIILGQHPSEVHLDNKGLSLYIINWKALEYWDLNPDLLPATVHFINKPPSIYKQYGVIIWFVGILILVLLTTLILLFQYILKNRKQHDMFTLASKRFDSILQVLPVGIAVVNKKGQYLVKITKESSFYDTLLTGISEEIYIHQDHGLMVESKLIPYIHQAIYSNQVQQIQYEVTRENKVYYSYLYPIGKELFKDEAAIWVQIDVSPQVELQNNLNMIINQTKQADGTKDKLISFVYKKLQEPLYTILKNAEEIQHHLSQDFDKELSAMNISSKKIMFILNNIRDYIRLTSKTASYRLEPTDFSKVFDRLRKKYAVELESRNILFRRKFPPILPILRLDKRRIVQILSNLLGEAIQSTINGNITLCLYTSPNQHPNYLDVTIILKDTGQGIPLRQQKILFESLQNIDYWLELSDTDRVDLSLMVTNKIIQSMGGNLQIQSKEYEGTEFTIFIPMIEVE